MNPLQPSDSAGAIDLRAAELPHGGTLDGFRLERAQWARLLHRRSLELARLDGSPTRLAATVTEAAANAWGVVALLEWLAESFGPGTAWRAAAIVQDIHREGDTWDCRLLDVAGLDSAGDPPTWPG